MPAFREMAAGSEDCSFVGAQVPESQILLFSGHVSYTASWM
jgi:hypothetical protein